MKIVRLPTKLPAPDTLELPRAQLAGLLKDLAGLLTARSLELMEAENAPQFAAVVRELEKDTAEASAGWAALSKTIRESWGI